MFIYNTIKIKQRENCKRCPYDYQNYVVLFKKCLVVHQLSNFGYFMGFLSKNFNFNNLFNNLVVKFLK